MPVVCEIAQTMHTYIGKSAAYGPPNDARFQHRPEHFWENGKNIDAHRQN